MFFRDARGGRQASITDPVDGAAVPVTRLDLYFYLTHCQLMARLQRAGTDARERKSVPTRPDAD